MRIYKDLFGKIISLENLFAAWDAFRCDKRNRRDVQVFEMRLEENIFQLYRDLRARRYKHGPYSGFWIHDPKLRHIHKATVRDRILHHAVFTVLNPIFEPTFIADSFSCRIGKGTHKGIEKLAHFLRKISGNGHDRTFALKCDIRKFFDTIDHNILLRILGEKIKDADTMWLMREIVESYSSNASNLFERKGVPIGNLTSQIFANVYMNELDQFMKHKLKVKYYLRYTDDFVIVADSREYLVSLTAQIGEFLNNELALSLHPKKVVIRKFHQGIDFLGYVIFPKHILIRSKTKHRILKKLEKRMEEYRAGDITGLNFEQSLQSYLGVLSHADAYAMREELLNRFWIS